MKTSQGHFGRWDIIITLLMSLLRFSRAFFFSCKKAACFAISISDTANKNLSHESHYDCYSPWLLHSINQIHAALNVAVYDVNAIDAGRLHTPMSLPPIVPYPLVNLNIKLTRWFLNLCCQTFQARSCRSCTLLG